MTDTDKSAERGVGPLPRAPIRQAVAWLLGRRVVVLEDFDGETAVRLERIDALGRPYAKRMLVRRVLLNPGGSISPPCYVHRWHLLADYRMQS